MNQRTLRLELLAAVAVALLLLAAIFAVSPRDQVLATDLQRLTNPLLDIVLRNVSVFGNLVVEGILIGLVVAILVWQRRMAEALFVVAATVGAGALGSVIKVLVGRPRPLPDYGGGLLWRLVDRYGFPSGHAVFYTAFFGAVAFLLWARGTGRARWAGIVLCLALIVLVGPSRVYLGAHWPSDVLAGYLVGGAWLFAVVLFAQWRYRW